MILRLSGYATGTYDFYLTVFKYLMQMLASWATVDLTLVNPQKA